MTGHALSLQERLRLAPVAGWVAGYAGILTLVSKTMRALHARSLYGL